MMQFTLTVATDNPDDLSRVLAALGAGNAATTTISSSTPLPVPGAPSLPSPIATTVGAAAPTQAAGASDDDDGAPADPNAPAVDGAGLPWDERIHSSSRKTGKDGTWNKRRGGPSGAELAAIEAELRARTAPPIPVAQPQPVAQPMPMPTPPIPDTSQQPVPVPQPMPIPAPVPIPQPVPVPQPVAAAPIPAAMPTDFHTFMTEVSARMAQAMPDGSPKLHAQYLAELSARIQQATGRAMTAITDLAKPELADLIGYTVQVMQMDGRW